MFLVYYQIIFQRLTSRPTYESPAYAFGWQIQITRNLWAKTIPKHLRWCRDCGVTARIGEYLLCLWVAHLAQMGKWPWSCISTGQDSFNELNFERNSQLVAEFQRLEGSESYYYTSGHTHIAPMGEWPWHCTSTGHDGCHELNLEWIRSVVAKL